MSEGFRAIEGSRAQEGRGNPRCGRVGALVGVLLLAGCGGGAAQADDPDPERMSSTSAVPDVVPSLAHSSRPVEPSFAENSTPSRNRVR